MSIFPTGEPTINVWKTRRDLFTVDLEEPKLPDEDDPEPAPPIDELPKEKMWLHDMRVSVFMRKPFNVTDEKYKGLALTFRERLPSVNWDELMQYIEHKDENCIRGDVFSHPNRKRFDELDLFDRGEHKQTQEMFDKYAAEEDRKIAAGEIPDPDKEEELEREEDS